MQSTGIIKVTSHFNPNRDEQIIENVRGYGSNIIVNELRSGVSKLEDFSLTIEEAGATPHIKLEHVDGHDKGRKFIFEPIAGEDDAWSELLTFVKAVLVIWAAGYRVT